MCTSLAWAPPLAGQDWIENGRGRAPESTKRGSLLRGASLTTERSDQVYHWYIESSQKFDYFMVGVSLAMVGYLGARYIAAPLGWNPETIELAAIGSLLFSGISGLKRIETYLTFLSLMQQRLREEEAAGALTGLGSSGTPALNMATGEILLPTEALTRAQYHKAGAEVAEDKLNSIRQSVRFWYRVRNFLLMLGLALLILARVAVAYV